MNPSWNRWMTDPDGPHRVLVPEVVADGFTEKLAALDAQRPRAARRAHRGAGRIARLHRRPLQGAGVLHRPHERRHAGGPRARATCCWVPAGDVSQLRAGLGSDMERRVHRVKSGESLWSISRRYGMTVTQLARMNHISTKAHAAARPAPAGRGQRRQRRHRRVRLERHAAGGGHGRQGRSTR